jgi:L-asparaginase II
MRALPGAVGKIGAEAVYVVALPDGRTIALKGQDGADRVRLVAMVSALKQWGVLDESWVDPAGADQASRTPVLGGGRPVGELRAAFVVELASG